jgi:hypothetical protein
MKKFRIRRVDWNESTQEAEYGYSEVVGDWAEVAQAMLIRAANQPSTHIDEDGMVTAYSDDGTETIEIIIRHAEHIRGTVPPRLDRFDPKSLPWLDKYVVS